MSARNHLHQDNDWNCPSCASVVFSSHRECPNCHVDRDGKELPAEQCAWCCAGCGKVNRAEAETCRGKDPYSGQACRHLRSVAGQIGMEFRSNDWICDGCHEENGAFVRNWATRLRCFICGRERMAMEDVRGRAMRLVKDFPQDQRYYGDR